MSRTTLPKPGASWVFILALAVAGTAHAVPWFPSDPGPTFTYSGDIGPVVIIGGGDGTFYRAANMQGYPYLGRAEHYRVVGDGDVELIAVSVAATGMVDRTDYDPPLTYLDFPLTAGKTWTSQAALVPDFGDVPTVVTLTGHVHGGGTITVPAGTFEIVLVELTLTGQAQGLLPRTGFLFLHHQLGPVGDLVSWTGVVGIGPICWGSLKAAFR